VNGAVKVAGELQRAGALEMRAGAIGSGQVKQAHAAEEFPGFGVFAGGLKATREIDAHLRRLRHERQRRAKNLVLEACHTRPVMPPIVRRPLRA
jgi:hypothetical protein